MTEISTYDVILFFMESWKRILLAAIVGMIFGLAYWHFLKGFEAELKLQNNFIQDAGHTPHSTYGLDLVSWRTIQMGLPSLANQMVKDGGLSQDQANLYRAMSEELWWKKNVVPKFAFNKTDAKEFASLPKNLDEATTTITSLSIKAGASSRTGAIESVETAADFLLKGGAYLQVNSLINSLEGEVIIAVADINAKITETQIELAYLQEKAKGLERLIKRFPGATGITGSAIQTEAFKTNFLPLNVQLIAVNTDINDANERLKRLADRLKQITIINSFLEQNLPVVKQNLDGIALIKALVDAQDRLRGQLREDDINGLQPLNNLRAQLLVIEARFTKGLEAKMAPTTRKQGILKSAAMGLMAGLLLSLFMLLGIRVLRHIR